VKASLKIVGIVIALGLLAGVMAYLAGFFEEKIPTDFSGVVPATDTGQVIFVKVTAQPLIEQAAGTLRAKVETVISPIITATISSIAVWAGDEVQVGQELVTFDPGAVSKAERDRMQTSLRTARAELVRLRRQKDEAQTALSYSKLTAPIAGRIVERLADPGDTARQGEPLLRMYDPTTLRLEASVRESVASKLAKGQQLSAEIDALKKQYPVVVDEIVPSADPGSRSFLVKVSLADGSGLYPGMFGRLMIPLGQTEKITIPRAAVTQVGQLDFVTVKTKQGPVRRYERLGQPSPDERVEIISGLKAGEQILLTKP
jgi:multidrug efflux pump subunit AcrA (membrane-fusion protein)